MLKQKTLALFFTYSVSLREWQRVGNLDRELKPYIKMAEDFKSIYLITYGKNEDQNIVTGLPSNITVLSNKWNMPSFLYSLLIPFLFYKEIKTCFILKTCQMNGAWSAVLAKLLLRKKLVIRCGYEWYDFAIRDNKSIFKRTLIRLIEYFSYSFADKIVITSESAKLFIIKNFHINSSKVLVIPNYIDTDLFKPLQKGLKSKVTFVGRFTKQKNLHALVDAISGIPEIELSLVGSGELSSDVINYATKQLKERVKFLGNIPNDQLPNILCESQIFILPSFYEGNPKTLLEAMSCGRICVGTKVEGIEAIIHHKKNGYLCDTDSGSIHSALLDILRNEDSIEALGVNARENIVDNFSLDKCLKKELSVYSSFNHV